MNKQYRICVIGAWRNYSPEAKSAATEVGQWLAKNKHILITGACLGIPQIAARSYKKYGGTKSVGFSPANGIKYHKEENGLTTEDLFHNLVFMDSDKPLSYSERNIVNINNSDAVILISGRMGALMEYCLAHDQNKPVAVVEGVGEASNIARKIEVALYGKTKSLFGKSVKDILPILISKIEN